MKFRNDLQDENEIKALFLKWLKGKVKILFWQQQESGVRNQIQTVIYSLNSTHTSFTILGSHENWNINAPFYFYIEETKHLFRTYYEENIPGRLVFSFPRQLMVLLKDDEFLIKTGENLGKDILKVKSLSSTNRKNLVSDLGFLSIDEEDKIYAEKRASKRARPQVKKIVLLILENGDSFEEKLFDLSTGGLSFVTSHPERYSLQAKMHFLAFDKIPMDGLLKGEVVGFREVDAKGVEFKIGIKFIPS
jgi:hypothetical protein